MAATRPRPKAYLLVTCLLAACIPDMGAQLLDGGGVNMDASAGDTGDTDAGDTDAGDTDAGSGPDAGGGPDAKTALVAEGDVVFHTIAVPPYGNVGCAYCHCPDATGGCHFNAPRIIGKSRSSIANALQTVEEMDPVDPTEHQIDAVAAYLAYLATL